MTVKYEDVEYAFNFASFGGLGESEAYINIHTGKIHCYSEGGDNIEPLPDDVGDETKYLALPHKHDLDLGRELNFKFIYEYAPDDVGEIESMFHRKGAYSKFRHFIERKELLEQWYEYERTQSELALREWCELNEVKLEP